MARALGLLTRAVVLVAVTAGAASAGRLLEQHVRSAEAFATREIDIQGLARLSREEVLKTAGLALGKNVFAVSPEQARENLLAHPWIAEAVVTRRLPSRYRIELRVREVAAILMLETLYLVSEDAKVFKQVGQGDPVDLPIITGVDPGQFRADLTLRKALLANMIGLLHDYRDAGLWQREPIAQIHVQPDQSATLYVGKDALEVRLGTSPFRKKLTRLRGILDELRGDAARPAYVYLDNERRPDRVAVRLR